MCLCFYEDRKEVSTLYIGSVSMGGVLFQTGQGGSHTENKMVCVLF